MASKQHDAPAGPGAMRIEPVFLPEFGLAVSWAMCRNAMCPNFGVHFTGEIPNGRKQVSDDRYTVRLGSGPHRRSMAEIHCRHCGQSARLASNAAIRPIARYFLSLSLPFADCPDTECQNHGINVFEHWTETGSGQPRHYRRHRDDAARCSACGKTVSLGTARDVMLSVPAKAKQGLGEAARALLDKRARRAARSEWANVIEGVLTRRTIADTLELGDMDDDPEADIPPYYRNLERIGARLRDYHAFRNARLLRADIENRNEPITLCTDVIDISLKAFREDRRHVFLKVIATTLIADGAIFVLAAHPYHLPTALCPDDEALRRDHGRPDFLSDWSCVHHTDTVVPAMTTRESLEAVPDLGRGGCFIRSPYAEVAHFLVVQKMLTRFGTIHNTMDAARDMFSAALVAYRDRILAGRLDPESATDRRRRAPKTAEIVLFQHDKAPRSKWFRIPRPTKRTDASLTEAWNAAEKRFDKQEVPADLLKASLARGDARVRASLFRRAFRGGYSEVGGWAWLHYPPSSGQYRNPRTLWLTRTPGKTLPAQGKKALSGATLQPVDSIFNSIRARVAGARRPERRATGQSYRGSYVQPAAILAELSIYLFARNYSRRRRTRQEVIPAAAMGLARSNDDRPDLPDRAWNFRLNVSHAKKMSAWLRR